MKRLILFLSMLIALSSVASSNGQKSLTNVDVLKMVQAGLAPDTIIAMIRNSPGEFQTDLDSVLTLKESSVPDEVIQAMIEKAAGEQESSAVSEDKAEFEAEPEMLLEEVGVYFATEDGELVLLEPEIVNWRTGGVVKSIATMGLTKGHVNGTVRGPVSKYKLNGHEELYIYTLEGTAGTEYQLLRLDEKKDRREFRAMTGGIIHASGGADKNAVYFEPARIGPRLYKFTLPRLAPGEYGLLPPGAAMSASAASVGKIHSFSVGY